jgi:hypothetical protein
VLSRSRNESDLFWEDLNGGRCPRSVQPIEVGSPDEAVEAEWEESVAELPEHYRLACELARQAEQELDEETVEALTFDLLAVQDQADLDEFVGNLARTVSRTAKKAAADVGRTGVARTVSKAARDVGRSGLAKTITKTARDVGRGLEKVGSAVPAVATIVKLASRATPLGALARSTYGALSAALRGQNIAMGALDGLAGTPVLAAVVHVAGGVLRGQNIVAAAKLAAKVGISDAREALRLAAMVAPFVPGIGTGVGAALGAADALANGQPITQALIAGVRGAIPGGVVAQAAFDTAAQLAQGKRLDQALLTAARNRLPPGPAQAAFDTGVAIAQGKKLQDAALKGAGALLPASPYAADLQSFARRALAGDNLGDAALSTAGQAVIRRVKQQGGDLVATVQGRAVAALPRVAVPAVSPVAVPAVPPVAVPAVPPVAVPAVPPVARPAPRGPVTLEQAIAAANLAERRGADQFLTDLGGKSSVQASAAIRR